MSNDPFEEFRHSEDEEEATGARFSTERDLLVFAYAGDLYAVNAAQVEAVVPWETPAPLPRSAPELAGVAQDRGRIVTVVNDPRGRPGPLTSKPNRLIVCTTQHGHVGLPAERTLTVGRVATGEQDMDGGLVDSSQGPLFLIDVHALARALVGAG